MSSFLRSIPQMGQNAVGFIKKSIKNTTYITSFHN